MVFYLILPSLNEKFVYSMLLHIFAAEVLASFKKIKGIKKGDQEIKTVDFADGTTIFLRGITVLLTLIGYK